MSIPSHRADGVDIARLKLWYRTCILKYSDRNNLWKNQLYGVQIFRHTISPSCFSIDHSSRCTYARLVFFFFFFAGSSTPIQVHPSRFPVIFKSSIKGCDEAIQCEPWSITCSAIRSLIWPVLHDALLVPYLFRLFQKSFYRICFDLLLSSSVLTFIWGVLSWYSRCDL